jgi:uncharacterized protein YwbE
VTLEENAKYLTSYNDTGRFTVSKVPSSLNVTYVNITLGDNAVFYVSVPADAYGNVAITIDNSLYGIIGVRGGSNKYIIPDLTVGLHNVTMEYSGNFKYLENRTTVFINVDKIKTTPDDFKVNDTGNGTIIITVPENVTGNITVFINGENKTVNITNGTAVVNILNITNATPGANDIIIIYNGDENHTNVTFNATVMIPKWNAAVNASGIDINEGFDEIITVTVIPVNATGIVLVDVEGIGYYGNITKDGKVQVTIPNLKKGNYTAMVIYQGNEYFNEARTNVSFKVYDKIEIIPNGGGNNTVIVYVPGNHTNGTVTIVINGTNYTGNVTNGVVIINLTNVTPGDHNATIIYKEGNNTFIYNTTISIPKWKSNVTASAIDINEGFDETVTVYVSPVNATGIALVEINGKGYYTNVTGGVAKVVIPGLVKGNYTAKVKYSGDKYYNESSTTVSFKVFDGIVITPNGTNNNTVIVYVPGNHTNGTVTIVINGTNYTGNVTDGVVIINLTNVTPGDHNATIIYKEGNNTFIYNTTISIPKWKSNVTATAIDINEGFDETITVYVSPVNATGLALVEINGKGYFTNVTDGVAKVVIPGLVKGNYTAKVKYSGDNYYNESSTTVSFKVFDGIVITPNGTNNNTVIVYVPGNHTNGTVTIVINGTNYTGNVTDGVVIINLTNVTPGDHNATIIYKEGNNTFIYNTTISIPKWKSNVTATAIDINEGFDETITVYVSPINATGLALVEINGKGYFTNVTGGVAKVVIPGLVKGNYTAKVKYSGDNYYNESSTTVSFKVFDGIVITPNGTNNNTVIVYVPGNHTNGTVTIVINGTNYTGNVTDGVVIINLTNVTPGDHNATIIYKEGNNTFIYNTTISIPKWKSNVTATAIDINEGFDETITVYVSPVNATGIVLVEINGKGYYNNVTDGVAKVVIPGLVKGNYTAKVKYSGDNYYNESSTTVSFKVYDGIVITPNGTNNNTVIVYVPGNHTNGTVTIVINGTNYTGNVTDGVVIINLTNVTPGDHNTTIIYKEGNNTFIYNTTISILKWKSNVTASAIDINEGFDETITVYVSPVNATGLALVEINGKGYFTNVTDGVAKVVIPGLVKGNYTAKVKYSGDNCYNESSTTVSFKVFDGIVITPNGTNNNTVIVYVPGNHTNGTVTIVINGTNYTGNVTDGVVIINLTNVTPGDHNATIIYVEGNNTFQYNTTISIPKWKSNVTASAIDINEGFDETITVNVSPVNATGIVLVEINGKGYFANVTDGVAKVVIPGLVKGNYTAKVKYSGDNYYNESSTTVSFKVYDKIVISPNGTGNNTVIVYVPGNHTNGTVIIRINGTNYTGNVTDGVVIINLTNVTPGDHNATIIYIEGNNTFEYNTTISIPKWDSSVAANATNIREGDLEIITIEVAPTNATGVVLVEIAGKGYFANVTDGKARLEIAAIKAGNYTAYVTYMGDRFYKNATTQAKFVVSAKINVTTNGTGNNTSIVIELPDNSTGNVTVIIDNTTYTVVNVTNGTVVVPLDGNVTPGEHNVTVIYVDGNGTASVVNQTITVTLYDTPITIEVENILTDDKAVVTVTVPKDITGEVQIDIDGITLTKKPSDGKAVFEVSGLLAGNKTVTATYAGDKVYAFNSTVSKFNVTKRPAPIAVSIDNSTAGRVTVNVTVPSDATGFVIVTVKGTKYGINLTAGDKSAVVPIKINGEYTADVTYLGDWKYLENATAVKFNATGIIHGDVSVEVNDTPVNQDVIVKVTIPDDATGNVTVSVDGVEMVSANVTGGDNYFNLSNMSEGNHTVEVVYSGDDEHNSKVITKEITVFRSINAEDNMRRGWESPYDYKAEFLDKQGHVLADTVVTFKVNGKEYKVKTDGQGIAYLSTSHLDVGTYDVTMTNPATGETITKKTTIVKRIVDNKDMTMEFMDGSKYVVRAIGDDGQPVGAGEVVGFRVNKVEYNGITDSKGYARLTIELNPTKYTITAQYAAYKVSNKITVKQTLKLVKKTITIKKSAKKIVLKATLKFANGKAIKGKKIVFQFKGKNYNAKTNKKGLAKVTIKKKVVKKLKKGKKYKYTAKYLTNYVKGSVKVKK